VKDTASTRYYDTDGYWDNGWYYYTTGTNDLKAHIDTIIDVTKADKMSYLGYSQGTLMIASALDAAVQEGNEDLAATISKLD